MPCMHATALGYQTSCLPVSHGDQGVKCAGTTGCDPACYADRYGGINGSRIPFKVDMLEICPRGNNKDYLLSYFPL